MKKIILSIEGMTCSACSNGLEKYLNKQQGIIEANVNLVMANALIVYDEKTVDIKKIERFIEQAGFKSLGLYNENVELNNNKNDRMKLIIFTILAIVLMYISMGHMIGLPVIPILNMMNHPIIYSCVLLIIASIFLIYGFDILKNGFKNLIHKSPNMDTLVAIGVISSYIYSLYGIYKIVKGNSSYVENLYFESSAIVIYFVKIGRYIDRISKDKTKSAIQKLVQITPKNAIRKVDEKEEIITIDSIKKDDILVCRSGDKIAVDGIITKGETHLDESFITGESKPVKKNIGQNVIASSINYDGYIEYRAEKIGKESTISEIVKLVLQATNTKMPMARIADKISSYFVPVVIIIAILTFIGYLLLGINFSNAISAFVTVLVVACPCSLGLATPLAIILSEGVFSTNGILVKKSEILENASKTDTIIFDKTGTLTYGTLKIASIKNYSKMKDSEIIKLVGSLEKKSTHPIKSAFIDYLNEKKIDFLEVEDFKNISGYGIIGKVAGKELLIGNKKLLDKYKIDNNYLKDEEEISNEGNSIVYVVINQEIVALIGVNDIIRENVKEVIRNLNKQKIKTIMLTGDNRAIAEKIANKIGITEVISDVTPKEKSNIVNNLKQNNKCVMMCGDGINDSPALANSDIGVSINTAADIAMDSSNVILTRNNLNDILTLIDISKRTVKNIKQNLFWAFFYNGLMIPIAMGALKPIGIAINPMIASFAMVLSSMTVILNTLRIKIKK